MISPVILNATCFMSISHLIIIILIFFLSLSPSFLCLPLDSLIIYLRYTADSANIAVLSASSSELRKKKHFMISLEFLPCFLPVIISVSHTPPYTKTLHSHQNNPHPHLRPLFTIKRIITTSATLVQTLLLQRLFL